MRPLQSKRVTVGLAAASCVVAALAVIPKAAAHQVAPSVPGQSFTQRELLTALKYPPPLADPQAAGSVAARRQSIPLAFGLSAVLPGAGQFYNGHWIKASAAAALEAGIVVAWASWWSQGHSGRDEYQATAHQYWSPVRYALWLNDYVTYLNSKPGAVPVSVDPITIDERVRSVNLSDPAGWTHAEQLAVRRLILQIRSIETQVYHSATGARFSHQLPFFGEQQYYELVGKYFQFAPGWSDYHYLIINGQASWIDDSGQFIDSIDPEEAAPDGSKAHVSARFFAYAEAHGTANDHLRRASRMTLVLVANHLVAAIEAAIGAKLHNDRLQARLSLYDTEPMLTMRVTF